jgi:hypothetical protein
LIKFYIFMANQLKWKIQFPKDKFLVIKYKTKRVEQKGNSFF